jgi:hypothetical protein
MQFVTFLFFCFATASVSADAFYKLVGYDCNRRSDRLVVTYDAAANSEGEAMMSKQTKYQWDPYRLVTMGDDDHIKVVKVIKRTCKLSDGRYSISLGPVPGNFSIQGMCGAWMSAWAEVRKGNRVIYSRADFERGVGCTYDAGEIVTRVEIRPKQLPPKVTVQPAEKLLSGL